MIKGTANWRIDLREGSHSNAHPDWVVDVLFIRREISTDIGF